MTKQVSFIDSDAKLIKQIEAFQKARELPTFIAAVRILCTNGLRMSDAAESLHGFMILT